MDALELALTPIQVRYEYTEALARRAALRFLRRYGRRAFILTGLLFVVGIVRLVLQIADVVTVGLLLMPILIPISWVISVRRAVKIARQLNDRNVIVTFDEQGLTFETTERRSFTTWSSLKEVWKFHDVWLLFPYGAGAGGVYTLIPTNALDTDAAGFMTRKLQEHATRVR